MGSTLTRCSSSFSQLCEWKQSQSSVVLILSSLYTPGCLIIFCILSQFHLRGDIRHKQSRCAPEMSVKDERKCLSCLMFYSSIIVNSGSPERRVAQRGHSNSRDSLSTSRENLWKPILLDRLYRGFLCCFLLFCFEGVSGQLRIESRSEDKKKRHVTLLFVLFCFVL